MEMDALPSPAKRPLARSKSRAALLTDVPPASRISVAFSNISAYVPVVVAADTGSLGATHSSSPGGEAPKDTEAAAEKASTSSKERQVLFNVTACVRPGGLLHARPSCLVRHACGRDRLPVGSETDPKWIALTSAPLFLCRGAAGSHGTLGIGQEQVRFPPLPPSSRRLPVSSPSASPRAPQSTSFLQPPPYFLLCLCVSLKLS